MKRSLIIAFVALGAAATLYFVLRGRGESASDENRPKYEFANLERRSLQNLVSATGTISARDVVEISTQVSGRLQEVYVDFNDKVSEGQLIAIIDPSVLDAQVTMAQADLQRTEAQLLQAKNNYERFIPVFEKGYLSENDFQPYQIALKTAEANLLSSQASLTRSQQNREYAEIRSPISGIVVDRTVEPGQTVAASLSAPKLFTIAADLSDMEILAKVDESDIGHIKVGQPARFTVAAYIDQNFSGTVEEIRLQPEVIQNVVNYTVVIGAANKRGQLLPGMTASVDFVVAEVDNALVAPSAALNLRPNEEMMALLQERRERMQAERIERPQGADRIGRGGEGFAPDAGGGQFGGGNREGSERRRGPTMLWYLENGAPTPMPVRAGVSDGAYTEILPLREREIPEDLQVISRVLNPGSNSNPSRTSTDSARPSGLRRLGF